MENRFFDDVEVGQILTQLQRGPMNTMVIMRWSAFQENWHRIHYDYRFATETDGLPDMVVSGSWKQHMIIQMLKEYAGTTGWVWKSSFQYRNWDLTGDIVTASGEVTKKEEIDGLGFVTCSIWIENQRGEKSTIGKATIVLQLKNGREVPYPFVLPKVLQEA
jgi:acyl dehydratase